MSLPVPEIGKRPRDAETESLIREALAEEEQRKKLKKGEHEAAGFKPGTRRQKGQTLAEVEQQEGGPVKESLVGMAAVQRALRRKKQQAADDETGLPDDIQAWEEDDEQDEDQQQQQQSRRRRGLPAGISEAVAAAMETDGGFVMTGFNMKQEREEGNIDEEGNFIPAKDEDEAAQDAWLNSEEAKDLSDKVKAAHAARQAALEAAEEAPALSETEVAKAQRDIAALLQANETVTQGLKRLGQARRGGTTGKAMGKREKQRLAAQQAAGGSAAAAADAAAAERDFTKLTELADLLLNSGGELDIYSHRKEQLQRWADAVLPHSDILAGGDDDDMFASDDAAEAEAAAPKQQQQQDTAVQPPGPAAAAAAAPGAPADGGLPSSGAASTPAPAAGPAAVDYAAWPVKELRRFLTERGVDSSSIVEKQELVDKVKSVADSSAGAQAPAGYKYDPSSGYYYSSESGMYWDSNSGGFYNGSDSKWYTYDAAAGQFKEWDQPTAAGGQ